LAAWLLGAPASVWRAATGLALLIAWKHRANLQRLLRGTEPRL
jgi:glycerol-3-phosphate acyltransferase PlsY